MLPIIFDSNRTGSVMLVQQNFHHSLGADLKYRYSSVPILYGEVSLFSLITVFMRVGAVLSILEMIHVLPKSEERSCNSTIQPRTHTPIQLPAPKSFDSDTPTSILTSACSCWFGGRLCKPNRIMDWCRPS